MHVLVKVGVDECATLREKCLQVRHGHIGSVNVPHFQLALGEGAHWDHQWCGLLHGLRRRVLDDWLRLLAARKILSKVRNSWLTTAFEFKMQDSRWRQTQQISNQI